MDVKIYTSLESGACDQLRRFLLRNKIRFYEMQIDDDPFAREELMKLTGGRILVPISVVGEKAIIGFRPDLLLARLGKHSPTPARPMPSVVPRKTPKRA